MSSRKMNAICAAIILVVNLFGVNSTFFLVDSKMNQMIQISGTNQPCTVVNDRNAMQSVMRQVDPRYVQTINPQMLNRLYQSCSDRITMANTGGFIFPGTKWCGPGNIARGFNDLGSLVLEDSCCRDHDNCPYQLQPGECKQGICNRSPFTRLHCECDEIFRKCLLNVRSKAANIIGKLYFNVASTTCFREKPSCPRSPRNNMSLSWLCDGWKFTTNDAFHMSIDTEPLNGQFRSNEISYKEQIEPQKTSKIDTNLETLFGGDEDIVKIMKDI